ncbi:MAG: 3-phosphoserine/phosphohydroxythreonine transaminase [Planctomycetes bacterium]|nr:3-phosphoserine/phosphohydroxythreonine transaminase [Planctomycetota bacterium]
MTHRIINFNPGPAGLPLQALQRVQAELLDYRGSGLSIMEASHRGKDYDAVHSEAQALFQRLFGMPDDFKVLLLQGGASLQFAMVPMNFLAPDQSADYVNTGEWATKAIKEAKLFGKVRIAGSSEPIHFSALPALASLDLDPDARYCHITTNNTIFGTQYPTYPDTGEVPLVCDMSSDILSRRIDWTHIGLVYAGAQKNLGPSGLTVVALRESFYQKAKTTGVPTMLAYRTHWEKDSLFNTPPTFAVYIFKTVLEWVDSIGGLAAVEQRNRDKAALVYGTIDANPDFFRGTVTDPASRSQMNATFRLPTEDLEKQFVAEALKAGFLGLKGHRSVGGIRVSMYNAVSPEQVQEFVGFMETFARTHG